VDILASVWFVLRASAQVFLAAHNTPCQRGVRARCPVGAFIGALEKSMPGNAGVLGPRGTNKHTTILGRTTIRSRCPRRAASGRVRKWRYRKSAK